MKKHILKASFLAIALALISILSISATNVSAEGEETDSSANSTSISISPVSKTLSAIEPGKTYEDFFSVTNSGTSDMNFETYASPYSYVQSEFTNEYDLSFANETKYTQITNWITFKDTSGNYVTKPQFTAAPGETVEVYYRITTPDSIPSGGQYAVLFAHVLSGSINASGIKTEATPGLGVYARSSTGETIRNPEISDLSIAKITQDENGNNVSHINASAKVKNDGNVDFTATGTLIVENMFGKLYYTTETNEAIISVIPDTELTISDEWEETPLLGLFNVTWTVKAVDKSETITQVVLILPIFVIIIMLMLLTFVIVWITILIRKRKERRSKLSV